MRAIKARNTKPELALRRLLYSNGFRYRLHNQNLPGKPDILLNRLKTAIFVNGCFWHKHKKCRYSSVPKSNKTFWLKKLNSNVRRDRRISKILRSMGYKVNVVWECDLRKKYKTNRGKQNLVEKAINGKKA